MMRIKNRKRFFVVSGTILVLLCIGGAIWWQQSLGGGSAGGGNNQQPASGQVVYDAQLGFSIVIPDSWQGNYQMNSGPGAVAFNYVSGTSSYPIFTVYTYPENEWAAVQKSTSMIVSIATHNGTVFAYNVTSGSLPKWATPAQEQVFDQMLKDVPAIVQNIQFPGNGK